jgi:predicted dehydrogenase
MLKIGVLGVGYLGRIHLSQLIEIQQVELIGFYDTNPNQASKIETEFSVKSFQSDDSLIESAEAIVISASTNSHYELLKKCIKAQKHIFVEKPIVTELSQLEELNDILKTYKPKIQIGYVERFNPAFLEAKKLISNPIYIESQRFAPFQKRGNEVSVELNLLIHDVDLALKLIPFKLKSVHANGVKILTEHDDVANVRIAFENGSVANLSVNRIVPYKQRKMTVYESDKFTEIDFLSKTVTQYFPQSSVSEANEQEKNMEPIELNIPDSNAIRAELSAFVQAILNDTPSEVSFQDAYVSTKLILEAF